MNAMVSATLSARPELVEGRGHLRLCETPFGCALRAPLRTNGGGYAAGGAAE